MEDYGFVGNNRVCPAETECHNSTPTVTVNANEPSNKTFVGGLKQRFKKMTAEVENRGQWGNQVEFILACLGYAVGLGNVWRFPYLCYANGGGAFLIPYAISLIIAGLPVFFMELALGQFSSLGPNCIFGKLAPLFQGVGWGMVVVSALVALYYNMIIAWVIFYFFASFRKTLMWETCTNYWNTNDCYSNRETARCRDSLNESMAWYFNGSCVTAQYAQENNVAALIRNSTDYNMTWKSPADEYFHNYVLEINNGLYEASDLGIPTYKLTLSLLAAWLIVFLCLIKGVQSTGKVVYFTATFPYVVLFILLIRGVTLPGARAGIEFYITPDLEKLKDADVWRLAATQIFYSLGPAFGGLLTMSSYNKFNNNCYRDAILVAVANCLTSVFAGFVIFSIVGFMAHDLQVHPSNVTASGPGLAFIAYPEALTRMPAGPFWSVLFFFMLITLGLDSQFAMVETVTTAMLDQFTWMRKKKTIVIGITCVVMFLLGIPLCCPGGMYVFTLINDYSAGYCLILLALFEVILVVYVYGINRFSKDIRLMLGFEPNWYWKICWMGLTPLFLIFVFIFSLVKYAPSEYNGYTFTTWLQAVGWVVSVVSIAMVPIFAIVAIIRNRINHQPWQQLIEPTPEWCPAHERNKLYENGNGYAEYNADVQKADIKF